MSKLTKPKSKARATKSVLVRPPGTPVRVGTTPPVTIPDAGNSPSADCSSGEICFVCSAIIREATTEKEGDPALFCEGRHKRWAHTSCVGVSDVLYEDIQSCDTPWMCQGCSKEAVLALHKLPPLQEEVQLLRAESTGLKEELSETRALVTSLHAALSCLETKVSTVSATVELLQTDSSTPEPELAESIVENTHNLPESHQTQRAPNADATQQRNGGRHGRSNHGGRAGHRQRGQQRNQNVRQNHQQREQSNQVSATMSVSASSVAMPNLETDSQQSNLACSQKTQAQGVRRVWGTMKSCTPTAVKSAIIRLISNQLVPGIDNITVKRKYRRTSNNKLRWWFLVFMPEEALQKLEMVWEQVALQTSWKLEPCMAPANFLEPAVEANLLT